VSIFGSIMSKIFGRGEAAAAQPAAQPAPGAAAAPAAPPQAAPDAPAGAAAAPQGGAAQREPVDVEAVLTGMASQNPQKLDWRHSIVDLMKLLGLDSGLGARKELARELGYAGDAGDSAAMNVWLHGQVMRKLAENGGKVPDDLRA
jgi:hypothetical protein